MIYLNPNMPGGAGGYLTTGARIIGLLTTPELTDGSGIPIGNLLSNGIPTGGFNGLAIKNHITAYVRSLSGLAADKAAAGQFHHAGRFFHL